MTAHALFALGLTAGTARAARPPAQRCATAKLKAAGKGIRGEMLCFAKAQARGRQVDSRCLAKTQGRLDRAIDKAGSACPGTRQELDTALAGCVDQLHAHTMGNGKCFGASAKIAGKAAATELTCQAKDVAKPGTLAPCDTKEDGKTGAALVKAGGCVSSATIVADTDDCRAAIDGPVESSTTTTVPGGTTTTTTVPAVFLIVMNHENWSDVSGSSSAPYINNTLLALGAHAEQYYTPAGLHPDEPNYLWLEAGTNFGVTSQDVPATDHQATTNHLVSLLDAAGISWKAYQEDIDGTACPLADQGLYVVRHDPVVYFDDVTGTNDANDPYCIAHVRPYPELASDLSGGTVARYNLITPNVCHDMTGQTFGTTCNQITTDLVALADSWLSTAIPQIMASAAYTNNGVILIAWSEGSGLISTSDGPIGLIVVSPAAKAGYQNTIHYTHSSTLRTLEEIFGVSPLLNDAANATDLSDLFATLP